MEGDGEEVINIVLGLFVALCFIILLGCFTVYVVLGTITCVREFAKYWNE